MPKKAAIKKSSRRQSAFAAPAEAKKVLMQIPTDKAGFAALDVAVQDMVCELRSVPKGSKEEGQINRILFEHGYMAPR